MFLQRVLRHQLFQRGDDVAVLPAGQARIDRQLVGRQQQVLEASSFCADGTGLAEAGKHRAAPLAQRAVDLVRGRAGVADHQLLRPRHPRLEACGVEGLVVDAQAISRRCCLQARGTGSVAEHATQPGDGGLQRG